MEKKKGFLRKLLVLLTAAMLIGLFSGVSASAASNTFTIQPNKIYRNKKSGTYYHKITVRQSGYIGVQAYGVTSSGKTADMKIGLLNSRKKPLERYYRVMNSSNKYIAYYGVKKGTYYVVTKGTVGYKIRYAFGAVTEKSGSKKSAAKVLQQGKTRSGILLAGESGAKSDWYKARVVNCSSFKFSLRSLTNGGSVALQLQIPKHNVNKVYVCKSGETLSRVFQFLDQYGRPTGKKITGMVYFRIYRYGNDANTSGAYSLTSS